MSSLAPFASPDDLASRYLASARDDLPGLAVRELLGSQASTARHEHTLAGSLIGRVREVFDSSAELTDGERRARAETHDQLGHIVADTVAFLPSMRLVAAGSLRALLLVDPDKGLQDNALGFVKNFAEGAVLNRVGKLANPQGRFARSLTARFGTGLKPEVITHLSVGFGMGTVKAGFDPKSWQDSSGRFSCLSGLERTLKAGTFASLVSVPAGMVGMRISRAANLSLARGNMSESGAFLISGAGSGYAAGSVFGGLEALKEGRSLAETLALMHRAGVVGAGTGLFIHGYETLRQPIYRPQIRQASSTRPVLEGASPVEASQPSRVPGERLATSESRSARGGKGALKDIYEELRIPGSGPARPEDIAPHLEQLAKRLTGYNHADEVHYRRVNYAEGTWTSLEQFSRQTTAPVNRRVRIYDVEGHSAKIAVPEEYAAALDQVRLLRIRANEQENIYIKGPDHARAVYEAREALSKHPLANRALPEDFIPMLDNLPNRTLVRRLLILNEANPQDPWFAQIFNKPGFKSAASACESGEIAFFAKSRDSLLYEQGFHEWAHLVANRCSEEVKLFQLAASLERNGWYSRDYARCRHPGEKVPVIENWAVHLGEEMLVPTPDNLFVLAREAPVRAAVLGRALVRSTVAVPAEMRSEQHSIYMRRIEYLQKEVLPVARRVLLEHLQSGKPKAQKEAAELLGVLGDDLSLIQLRCVASSTQDVVLALAATRAALNLTRSPSAKFDLLVDLARPGSSVRNYALDQIRNCPAARGPVYTRFLQAAGHPECLPEIIKLIPRMPDARGQELAFFEALRLAQGKGDVKTIIGLLDSAPANALEQEAFRQAISMLSGRRETQGALALRALERNPGVRSDALEFLQKAGKPWMEAKISRFRDDPDTAIADRARVAIERIRKQAKLLELLADTSNGGTRSRPEAIAELANLHDYRAIPQLVELACGSGPAAEAATVGLRTNFTQNLVSFYVRQAARSHPERASRYHGVLQRLRAS